MKLFKEILVVVLAVIIVGCASSSTPSLPAASAESATNNPNVLVDSYLIGIGDQVRIDVWQNPELSVTAPVRPDGKIVVPLLGDVMAAGLQPAVLSDNIKQGLSNYIKNPNVSVILTQLQGHEFLSRVRVTGAVTTNISMPYQQGMTVLDAVLEAGGLTIYANSNKTKLHRRTKSGSTSYDIHLKDILENGKMETNVLLVPGDVITVPESAF